MYQLIVKDAAYKMLDEAYWWYEEQLAGLGERFLSEVDDCFEKLRKNPLYYTKINEYYRRIVPKSFPYKIVFEVAEKTVIIYAIFHASTNQEILFD